MRLSVDAMEVPFFRFLAGELSVEEFERWVYATPQLENYLGAPAYLEMISFNFRQPAADYELSKLIYKSIPPARFHQAQIKWLLSNLLDGSRDAVVVFENLYELYNKGYHFLGSIGYQYDLGVYEIPKLTAQPLWDPNEFSRRREMLAEYVEPLRDEIQRMLRALETSEIQITDEGEVLMKPGSLQKSRKGHQAMGTYNILQTSLTCPHCETRVDVQIEIFFGNTLGMDTFAIGDQYRWVSGKAAQNGGRPEGGNLDGEGYTGCLQCGRDFFVTVLVREDRIQSARPVPGKTAFLQSPPAPPAATPQPTPAPARKPTPGGSQRGKITYNENWNLTPAIDETLEQLLELGVEVYSTGHGNDYTFSVPHGFSPMQQEKIDALMKKIAREVRGKLNYIDWYPHGYKFRIYPSEGK